MNHDTQRPALPPLVGTVLTDGCHYIDNLLAAAWKTLHLNQLLLRAGSRGQRKATAGEEKTSGCCVLTTGEEGAGQGVGRAGRETGKACRARRENEASLASRASVRWVTTVTGWVKVAATF